MAQKIGGSPQQPIRRTPNTALNQQKKVADEQQLLKSDLKTSQDNASVTVGRQNNKTAEDKKLTETPKEKVTLSSANVEQNEATAGPQTQQDAPEVQAQTVQEPPQKTADDLAGEFLGTFQGTTNDEDKKAISQKTQESMARLAQMGGDVNAPAVLAAETYNYAKNAISAKMPNATQAEIREAAKSDPEIAKNVKLLDATSDYLVGLKRMGGGPVSNAGTSQAQGQTTAAGDSAAQAQQQPTPGVAAPGVNPFATMEQQGGMPPGQQPGMPPGQPGDEVPFYHKTPQEQAELIQKRNSEMNEVMKIYAEMAAETRKTMAQIHALTMQTNQEIMDILRGVWLARAKSSSDHMNNVRKLITESWG